MLKDMVSYTDIDGQKTTKTLFFNLTQFEIEGEMELEKLQGRFQAFMDEVVGPDPDSPRREMTAPEKREMLAMVKTIIKHSYGYKDGKRFIKNDEVWAEFEQTGAFSAYLYQLFLQDDALNRFMAGIWPQGVDQPTPDGSALRAVPDDVVVGNVVSEQNIESKTKPKAFWEYTNEELLAMPEYDFRSLVERSKEGNNIPQQLLFISGRRKNQTGGETE